MFCGRQVPEDVKADRLQRVMRLGCAHALERSERYLGREEEVLVEERNPKDASQVRRRWKPRVSEGGVAGRRGSGTRWSVGGPGGSVDGGPVACCAGVCRRA